MNNHYDPNQPRRADGEWTDGGAAIKRAASDKKENKFLKPEEVKTMPAGDIQGGEDINDLERLLNKEFLVNGKFTEQSLEKKIQWAKSVDITNPVDVKITDDGTPLISDGHHRALAARILKKELAVNITKSELKPEVFDTYMDRLKRGFTVRQINPDGRNLNKTQYYKIPDLSIMNDIKNKDMTREKILEYYLSKQ